MITTASRPAFIAHAPEFDEIAGDGPTLARLAEVDAHEGPVYFADEDALYFTSVARPGPDRSPSVQIKRLPLSEPDRVSVLVEEANGANGMSADVDGNLIVCEQGRRDLVHGSVLRPPPGLPAATRGRRLRVPPRFRDRSNRGRRRRIGQAERDRLLAG